MIQTIHDAVQGRTRYRISTLYKRNDLKHHIETSLCGLDGIQSITASSTTGTVLVRYNSGKSADQILSLVERSIAEFTRQRPQKVKKNPQAVRTSPRVLVAPPRIKSQTSAPVVKARPPSPKARRVAANITTSQHNTAGQPWHTHDLPTVLTNLKLDTAAGLSSDEASSQLEKYGPNMLPEQVSRSPWKILLGQFCSSPVALLAVTAGISAATGGIIDAVAILGVVGMNAAIGYVTESQSERTIHSLKNLVTPKALVVRDASPRQIDSRDVVPGDVMVLRPGDYVGADARIIDATRLSIDESALTGESMPVRKNVALLSSTDIPIGDRKNMCYMGTLVTGGQGKALVVSTGSGTEMGTIQNLVEGAETPETPMSRQLDDIGRQLVYISGAMCGLVFGIGILRGFNMVLMLKTALSLAVAAVPEGLPTVATTTLALGIKSMRRRGVLVRHLDAIEGLGATQVLCLDKTGTITANRMTIIQIYAGQRMLRCDKENQLPEPMCSNEYFHHEVAALLMAAALCNESEIISKDGAFTVNGTPTENALIHLALNSGLDVQSLRRRFILLKMYQRSENRNFMLSLHTMPDKGHLAAVKGSPAEVLSFCSSWMCEGQIIPLTEEHRLQLQNENEKMAGNALRVLGVAFRIDLNSTDLTGPSQQEEEMETSHLSGFVWAGLVGMADPIRPGVTDLMRQFHEAGIKTVMITGDQSATAYTVGKALQLNGEGNLNILDATALSTMSPDTLAALADKTNVFARVSPAHKLRIVEAYQHSGKVVAMTGDGINDGPALKKADVGVAMGRTGTDVAREIADVVLEDDELETMLAAVKEGRTIYVNVRKALHFLLATNFSEIIVTFAATAVGAGQPLTQMQLLWINMMSDIFPGLALSMEPPDEDILKQPPRDPNEPIIRRDDMKKIASEALVISIGSMGAYSYGLARYGIGPRASSLAFVSLTCGQLLHALHCRSERHKLFESRNLQPNKYLKFALGTSFALQALAMFVPGLRSLLGITRIGVADALVIGGASVAPLLVNDFFKNTGNPEGSQL